MQALTLKFGKEVSLTYLICNGLRTGDIQVILLNSNRTQRRAPNGYSDKRGGVTKTLWHDLCREQKRSGSILKKLAHKEIPKKIRETAGKIFKEMSRAQIIHLRKPKKYKNKGRFVKSRFSKIS